MDRLENGKDRVVGRVKETAGKITDMEDTELKGKLKSMKADIGDKIEDVKDNVYEKANDLIDRVRNDKNAENTKNDKNADR